ncbi:MCE family protein [Mycobacterium vicinigordonae]|uniref:MCE family protein n=2 Tax=Mycobacterium vicinigordonae TaxID=1719132 RepID=A0A7D6HXE0_9MYCO|nr:MCE family protein [Mycobacterium vicinigordonae]
MERRERRSHLLCWAAGLFGIVTTIALVCSALFEETFKSFVPVKLVSDRGGLVMESGARVKFRGVEVGRVANISGGTQPLSLTLEMFPDQMRYIPANVQAEIKANTVFGAKFVDLIDPEQPSRQRLTAGAVLRSKNVSTEVNTLFENIVDLLKQIDVDKLHSVLTALAEGVRGQGERMGQAITGANNVLLAVNPRMDTITQNWRSFKGFSDAYSAAAKDILATLDAASATSSTIVQHSKDLDSLLLSTIGFSRRGIDLLGPNMDNFINGINVLEPTTNLLLRYSPTYTCLLVGSKYYLDNGGYAAYGGNGRTYLIDAGLLFGDDPYRYPDNLPIVAAKGGPGGRPGCGSLPDVSKNFPVRYEVTNTGWGTGLDMRPNPGIGHPWWINLLPVTRATPEPPSVHGARPPAIGPVPYPGAPPYGAPLYAPDGTPLYPGVPPASPPPAAPTPLPPGQPSTEPAR